MIEHGFRKKENFMYMVTIKRPVNCLENCYVTETIEGVKRLIEPELEFTPDPEEVFIKIKKTDIKYYEPEDEELLDNDY
jgi:hypothetical protein